jgi:hypothetical protein
MQFYEDGIIGCAVSGAYHENLQEAPIMTKSKAPKFTKKEQAKLAVVFAGLRAELRNNQVANNSLYDNDLGCGNCGDTGPFHKLLYRLEQAVGLRAPNVPTSD